MPVLALQVWLRVQALLWLPGLALLATGRASGPLWAAAMAISGAVLWALLRAGRAADLVTMGRFAGLCAVVGCAGTPPGFGAFGAALAVVLLDLADGALARRLGPTPQGAVLDMEVDQFAVLGLSALIVLGGGGLHVLALPALRYVFVLAMAVLGLPAHVPKPVNGDNRRGRRCCAIVMGALLLALWPGLPGLPRDLATGLAVAVLAWSFGSDARFLLAKWRARRTP